MMYAVVVFSRMKVVNSSSVRRSLAASPADADSLASGEEDSVADDDGLADAEASEVAGAGAGWL
jgi:hypothetical protein